MWLDFDILLIDLEHVEDNHIILLELEQEEENQIKLTEKEQIGLCKLCFFFGSKYVFLISKQINISMFFLWFEVCFFFYKILDNYLLFLLQALPWSVLLFMSDVLHKPPTSLHVM